MAQEFNEIACGHLIKTKFTAGRTYDKTWYYEDQDEYVPPTYNETGNHDFTLYTWFRLYIAATDTGPPLFVVSSSSAESIPASGTAAEIPAHDEDNGSVEIEGSPSSGVLRVKIDASVTRALQDVHGLRWGVASLEGGHDAGLRDLGQVRWRMTRTPQES